MTSYWANFIATGDPPPQEWDGTVRGSLAKRLAVDNQDSVRIRAAVRRTISGESSNQGGILRALRRSPLVGAELNLERAK
jgi:hypothetical protein